MTNKNYTYSFVTTQEPAAIFDRLTDVRKWWSGLFNETITGKSQVLGDEFSFSAGDGMHYSKQKLTGLVPKQSLVWEVVESRLSFLKDQDEWTGTHIRFDLAPEGAGTRVTFTHQGLSHDIECYGSCSSAWNGYLTNLEKTLG